MNADFQTLGVKETKRLQAEARRYRFLVVLSLPTPPPLFPFFKK
jgi:hypothetical protein